MKTYEQYIIEKIGDDYSNWKEYQLFHHEYPIQDMGRLDYCCITEKEHEYDQIRKIYEYDQVKDKIIPVKAFYFSPNIDDPDVVFQSDDLDEVYHQLELLLPNVRMKLDAMKYNLL